MTKPFDNLSTVNGSNPDRATLIFVFVVLAFGLQLCLRLFRLHAEQPAYQGFTQDIAAIVFAMLALPALALGYGRRSQSSLIPILAGGMLGLMFFVATLGFALVDPTQIDWLMRGDWAQHFVGWHLYRSAPWQWPPGAFDTFWYPVGTAIIYTDSLPLFAIPLKLVSPWLPDRFQYIGFWLLINCILSGVFGALLTRCFSRILAVQLVGASFALLAPIFLSRIGHDTLTAQWLILAALWLYFRNDDNSRHKMAGWLLLSAVSALVHPYLNAMVLALAFAHFLRQIFAERSIHLRIGALQFLAVFVASAACWWLAGALTLRPSGGGIALGIYNANLLTWFDSQGMSRWLPALPARPEQWEGKGYLGLGLLLLTAVAGVLALCAPRTWRLTSKPLWPLLVVVAAVTLYAFGTRFTFGMKELLDVTPSHPSIFGAFRGSGRFIWISVYLITALTVATVALRAGRLAVPLLICALIVQWFDLAPLHDYTAHMRHGVYPQETAEILHDTRWQTLAAGRRHITLVPPPACGKEAAPYLPFSILAGDHGLTINSGYLARFDEKRTFEYCSELKAELDSGRREADTLYIVHPDQLDRFRQSSTIPLECEVIENYTACWIGKI